MFAPYHRRHVLYMFCFRGARLVQAIIDGLLVPSICRHILLPRTQFNIDISACTTVANAAYSKMPTFLFSRAKGRHLIPKSVNHPSFSFSMINSSGMFFSYIPCPPNRPADRMPYPYKGRVPCAAGKARLRYSALSVASRWLHLYFRCCQ